MSRQDTYRGRSELAKEAERRLKAQDDYERDFSEMSDKDVIDKYLESERQHDEWANDRR